MDMGKFWFFNLGLLRVGVFDSCFLGLHIYSSVIKKVIIFEAIDIQVLDLDIKFKARFGL